ncbi:MAG: hypothetical protein OEZ01_12860, partial [Candidatus Heimdallarchaeota archaeon]|nr:hypothetical protein [Candidatus Heimdallarchaeota archaeon]
MAEAGNIIQLDFHMTNLTGNEAKRAEEMGMLLLASDFIGSSKVGKAKKLDRISKINVPILLSQTKSGDYIPINPSSKDVVKIPSLQLVALEEVMEFCENRSNLDLNKMYTLLMKFKQKDFEITGGYKPTEMTVISNILQAPRVKKSEFSNLSPIRNLDDIKTEMELVNEIALDSASLKKAVDERIAILENALTEEAKEYSDKYDERNSYWKTEVENKNELLQKRLKERDKELDKSVGDKEKEVDKQIKDNFTKFKTGIAKNIRRDEKPIEKLIQDLEALVAKPASLDMVDEVKTNLLKLSDTVDTLKAAVTFAIRQTEIVKQKEEDLKGILDAELHGIKLQAERDKKELEDSSKRKEKERDVELNQLKEDREVAKKRLAKFKDLKSEWIKEIMDGMSSKEQTQVIPKNLLKLTSPKKLIQLYIPMYLFQYKRENDVFSVAVPPVIMPEDMRKPKKEHFFGDYKTVFYELIVPNSDKLFSNWLEHHSNTIEMTAA